MATNYYATGKSKMIEPGHGNYPDEWDLPVNSNFGVTDALVSGSTAISVASATASSPFITLSFKTFADDPAPWTLPLAGQNLRLYVTGGMGFDVTILIPAGIPGFWFVDNQTTGAFKLYVKTTATGGTGPSIKQGMMSIIYCDGTNVTFADGGNIPPIATETTYGIVTQGLLPTNCVQLDAQGKTPWQTDKYIISTGNPDPNQGYQDWLWMKVP